MCNCLKEITPKITEQIKQNNPHYLIEDEAELVNRSFVLSQNKLTMETHDSFVVKGKYIRKVGAPRTERTLKMNMIHAFCPYCGQPKH